MSRSDALPIEAVRDLLGIARAMYAAGKRAGISRPDLDELAEVGQALAKAISLARRSQPDTIGHRAAWDQAEVACSRLCRAVSLSMQAAPLVEAAAGRIRRIGPRLTAVEARKEAGKWRR